MQKTMPEKIHEKNPGKNQWENSWINLPKLERKKEIIIQKVPESTRTRNCCA